jgi:hypothetical protein
MSKRNYYGVREFLKGRPRSGRLVLVLVVSPFVLLFTAITLNERHLMPRLYNLSAKFWHILYPMAWWN